MDGKTFAAELREVSTWELRERFNNENLAISDKLIDLLINEGLCVSRVNQIMDLVKKRVLERPLA
ncbi:hypothetical protein [Paenibacillus donghaensis]|uniref:Uncharacterized protein n=1 Tax=Paenibacillus donghaensis TaxID=414771 RepID=A0A2Z2KHC1_9BACL|nr:hypothetical protein [Paenibacillus donghaensis]ASA20242.1 hypothetical protein B9T62_05160 [Paenibacillus donghaensis]